MRNNLRIAISVLNYNSSDIIIENINKMINYKTLDYIAIVDNCSTDNSVENLRAIFDNSNKVKILVSDKNGWYGYGQTIGCKYLIEQCEVDYVLVMTPANYIDEVSLEKMIDALDKRKDKIAIIAPGRENRSKDDVPAPKIFAWRRHTYFEMLFTSMRLCNKIYNKFLKKEYTENDSESDGFINVEVVHGSLYLINGEILKKINYFDKENMYGYEDCLSMTLASYGYGEGILLGTEFNHIEAYARRKMIKGKCRKDISVLKTICKMKLFYAEKYLKVSKIKLFFLKCAQRIGVIEFTIWRYVKSFFKKIFFF